MSDTPLLPPPVRNAPWAVEASVKADLIEHRLRIALAAAQPLSPSQVAAKDAVERLVALARQSVGRDAPWRGAFDWWRGTRIQSAYQSLHAAEIFLVDLLPSAELRAGVPNVVARADASLAVDDLRRLEIHRLPEIEPDDDFRASLKTALEWVYESGDQLHMRVRDFRNILRISALLITVLMAGLVVVVSLRPDALPFCFDPDPDQPGLVCPLGDGLAAPSAGDAVIVAGLGLLGGALAAAFSVRNIRGTSTPYDVPKAQALLKVPSGALTATAGILLLGGGFVPGLSQLDSQRQILAYALVLGYAQQLATRFVDDRAQSILSSVPSKEPPPADQAHPPAAVPQPRTPMATGSARSRETTGSPPTPATTPPPTQLPPPAAPSAAS